MTTSSQVTQHKLMDKPNNSNHTHPQVGHRLPMMQLVPAELPQHLRGQLSAAPAMLGVEDGQVEVRPGVPVAHQQLDQMVDGVVVVAGVGEAHGDLPALVVLEVVAGDLQVPVELVVVVLPGGDSPVQVRQDGIFSFTNQEYFV